MEQPKQSCTFRAMSRGVPPYSISMSLVRLSMAAYSTLQPAGQSFVITEDTEAPFMEKLVTAVASQSSRHSLASASAPAAVIRRPLIRYNWPLSVSRIRASSESCSAPGSPGGREKWRVLTPEYFRVTE